MSSVYSSRDFKQSDCLKSTKDFINCQLDWKGCQNLDEISEKVCNKEIKLHDVSVVKDNFGKNQYLSIDLYNNNASKKNLGIHHSER